MGSLRIDDRKPLGAYERLPNCPVSFDMADIPDTVDEPPGRRSAAQPGLTGAHMPFGRVTIAMACGEARLDAGEGRPNGEGRSSIASTIEGEGQGRSSHGEGRGRARTSPGPHSSGEGRLLSLALRRVDPKAYVLLQARPSMGRLPAEVVWLISSHLELQTCCCDANADAGSYVGHSFIRPPARPASARSSSGRPAASASLGQPRPASASLGQPRPIGRRARAHVLAGPGRTIPVTVIHTG